MSGTTTAAAVLAPPVKKATVLELVCPLWNARLAGPEPLSGEHEHALTESSTACAVAEPWGFTDRYAREGTCCRECVNHSLRIPNAYDAGGKPAAAAAAREFADHFVMEHNARFEQIMRDAYRREAGF